MAKVDRICTKCGKTYRGREAGKGRCRACRRKDRRKRQAKKKTDWNSLPAAKCIICNQVKGRASYYDPNNPVKCKTCCKKLRKQKKEKQGGEWEKKYWYLNLSTEERRKYAKRRYERLKQATPGWFEKEEVARLYKLAKEAKMHVDHRIPLFHSKVCGLHCMDNLQLLSPQSNRDKGNAFDPSLF